MTLFGKDVIEVKGERAAELTGRFRPHRRPSLSPVHLCLHLVKHRRSLILALHEFLSGGVLRLGPTMPYIAINTTPTRTSDSLT